MSREVHVRFCERLRGKFLRPTHLCLNIPPKYSVASIVGFLKGKSAIRLNKDFSKAKSTGKHFWIRGYFVSTVGLNEKTVRDYIKHQELSDQRQLTLPELN